MHIKISMYDEKQLKKKKKHEWRRDTKTLDRSLILLFNSSQKAKM